MVIRALPVLTGEGLTGAETFLDAGMHLTPFCDPRKTVADGYGGNLSGGQQSAANDPITDQGNC